MVPWPREALHNAGSEVTAEASKLYGPEEWVSNTGTTVESDEIYLYTKSRVREQPDIIPTPCSMSQGV